MTELIPADVRARLRTLQLRSRRLAGAHGSGQHASRSRGAGLEFAQYRAYEPGDEPRRVDWKLYARSDRYFVRESERESPLRLWLLIDATASAQQQDQARPGFTRLDAIRTLAACATDIALRQGDQVGLMAVEVDAVRLVPAGTGLRQRDRLWLGLGALHASGRWPTALERLRPVWERSVAGDVVLALGDCFDDASLDLLERLAAAGREVMQLQVLSADERDFDFTGGHLFRDPETGQELLGDGAAMRADYLQRFQDAQREREARLRQAGIAHATAWMDEPADAGLRRLLAPGARP